MNITVAKNLYVGVPAEQNLFWDLIENKTYASNKEVVSKNLKIITIDRPVVYYKENIQKIKIMEQSKGITGIHFPLNVDEINKKIESYKFLLTKNSILIEFSYSKSFPNLKDMCMDTIIDILIKKQPLKEIRKSNNIIYIDNKEAAFLETHENATGYFEFMTLQFRYEKGLFETLVGSNNILTGVINENIEYTKDEFIDEFIKQIKIKISKLYPNENILIN